jgi:rhodanese-related sulfurtransferase
MAQTVADMVLDAKTRIDNLTVEQTAAEQAAGQALVVDIREPEERARTGVIPGAVVAPRGMLEWWADPSSSYHRPEFEPSRRTILYCAGGGRSALAADALRELGYADVAHLESGIYGWIAAGQPTETDRPAE